MQIMYVTCVVASQLYKMCLEYANYVQIFY